LQDQQAAASSSSSSSSSRLPEIKVPWQVGTTLSALRVVPERGRPDHAVLWVALNRKIEWYPTWDPGAKSEMAVADKVRHGQSCSLRMRGMTRSRVPGYCYDVQIKNIGTTGSIARQPVCMLWVVQHVHPALGASSSWC
jgi:hypothetical protein